MQLVVAPGEQKLPPPSPNLRSPPPPPGGAALQLTATTTAPKIAARETTECNIGQLLG
jgi:hypothetical protein